MDKTRLVRLEAGSRLREARINMGKSQKYFADKLGISLSAYKKIEGGVNNISVALLRKLWQDFHISSDYLLFDEYLDSSVIFDMLQNCEESEKMKLFLQLGNYFIYDKAPIYSDEDPEKNDDILTKMIDDLRNAPEENNRPSST